MDGYHENELSDDSRELHRALKSLMEELEAVDWYQQRIDASSDEALRAILEHNRDEELEHAAMVIEWLRRRLPHLDVQLRARLFTEGPIAEVDPGPGDGKSARASGGDLGIGSMRAG